MASKIIQDQLCPWCAKHINRASNLDDEGLKPNPGDVMLCLDCGEAAIYAADLRLRKPTDDEHVEIADDPDYQKHRLAWSFWTRHGRPGLRRHS